MKEKKLIPKRRFKEFENDKAWEQRKVEDLGNIVTGSTPSPSDTTNYGGNYLFVSPADIQENRYVKDTATKLSEKGFKQGRILKEGSTLFVCIGSTIGKVAQIKGIAITNQQINSIEPTEKYNDDFIYSLMKHKAKEIKLLAATQAVPIINKTSFSQVNVIVASNIEEQIQIGTFFKDLDKLITLYQRKLKKLKEIKSAYLSEMFPKEGEKYPKRRFDGFTDPWEQRKFEEILDYNDGIRRGPFGGSLKKDIFVPHSDYVVYEQRNAIYDKYETRYCITKEKYDELISFKVNAGDFIMSGAGTIGRISRVPEGIKQGIFNQALIRIKIDNKVLDSEYFLQWIRSEKMQIRLTEANPASAMVNLVPMSEIKSWQVKVPKIEEQKMIGSFLKHLDSLITLHQRKLEKLENLKKAYLNEMFV